MFDNIPTRHGYEWWAMIDMHGPDLGSWIQIQNHGFTSIEWLYQTHMANDITDTVLVHSYIDGAEEWTVIYSPKRAF